MESENKGARIIAGIKGSADLPENAILRSELKHGLDEMRIHVPALRDRTEDIPQLINGILNELCKQLGAPQKTMSDASIALLKKYSWPGNIRELRSLLYKAIMLTKGPTIWIDSLPIRFSGGASMEAAEEDDLSLASMEKNHIQKVLSLCNGNKKKAAKLLGIDRSSLYNKNKTAGNRIGRGELPPMMRIFSTIRVLKRGTFLVLLSGLLFPSLCAENYLLSKRWNEGQAEILEYDLKIGWLESEHRVEATIVTDRQFYSVQSRTAQRIKKPEFGLKILNSTIQYRIPGRNYPYDILAKVKATSEQGISLVRQDVSIMSWEENSMRQLFSYGQMPVLYYHNSGSRQPYEVQFKKSPLVTEEFLWLYVRSLEPGAEQSSALWLLENQMRPTSGYEIQYCDVVLHGEKRKIKETEAWYVTITRQDGMLYEFWLLDTGLQQVLQAQFPDGTLWQLKNIRWERYWEW